MDKQEFVKIATGIKSAYPASKILEDTASMNFWYTLLKDIPYDVAENAVMEHICTNVYPPNIAEIRKLCIERCKKQIPSFDDAWGNVQQAIRTCGADEPLRAYELMDDITVSVVKNLGWTNICRSENPDATRANFRMAYEEKSKDATKAQQFPKFVAQNKNLIQERYITAMEEKSTQQIEQQKEDEQEEFSGNQTAEISSHIAEARRRILGGNT